MRYVQECFHGLGDRTHRCDDWFNVRKECWKLSFVPTRVMQNCLQWTCGAVAFGSLPATFYTGKVIHTWQICTLPVLLCCSSWNPPLNFNLDHVSCLLNSFLIAQAESLPCAIALGFDFYPRITVAINSKSVNITSYCDLILSSLVLLRIMTCTPFQAEMKCSN